MRVGGGFSFIHTADLHLDSPFRGFEQIGDVDDAVRDNVLGQLRNCTFAALDNIVNECIRREVDFLVLAGDIYDLDDSSLRAELRFRDAVARLAERGIDVFVAYGNHDYRGELKSRLSWPENVHFFAPGEVEYFGVERLGREVARVYGISYPQREVTDNYARRFKRHQGVPFAVGVLHCNVGGIPGHGNYAPCRLDDLVQSGFDYWALGHVHSRQVLRESDPCVVYPGNPQGRNPREGVEKGCYLVRVAGNGLVNLQFLPTDTVRWTEVAVSIAGMLSIDDLLNHLDNKLTGVRDSSGSRSIVCRIKLFGRGPLHKQLQNESVVNDILYELRQRFAGPVGSFIWPESLQGVTGIPVDKDVLRESGTLLGDLLSLSREARSDGELRQKLRESLESLDKRAGRWLVPPTEEEFDELLEAAEDLAIDLLWDGDAQ